MTKVVSLAAVALFAPLAAAAQDIGTPTVLFPGSLNFVTGVVAPSEPGNVITSATTEQGVGVWHHGRLSAVAYADITLRRDTQGHSWNNDTPVTTGIKAIATGSWGVAQAGLGVNMLANSSLNAPVSRALALSYWNAWRGYSAPDRLNRIVEAYPGHVYASSGYVTAAEPDNWINAFRIEQGATLFSRYSVAGTAFVGAGANRDTSRYVWNNRTQLDAGVKIGRPLARGVLDVSVTERRETSRITGEVRVSPVVSVNLWLGWNPHYNRK